jgi:hypothetical protein
VRKSKIALITIVAVGLLAGSMSGVSAESEDASPVGPFEFTGEFVAGPCTGEETTEIAAGVELKRGRSCTPTASMSDARLDGNITFAENGDRYLDGSGLLIDSTAISIENEGGIWREIPRVSVEFPGTASSSTSMYVFVGDGDYTGMTAVMEATSTGHGADLRGFILERELPPPPETASSR